MAVENEHYADSNSAHAKLAKTFFTAFDQATDRAYQYVVSVPSLHPFGDATGRTRHWLGLWQAFLADQRPGLMAAAFGYAIETLVSTSTTGFTPAVPADCALLFQYPSGGTIPDVVLTYKGTQIAWLDLTASNSIDHIYYKDDWGKKIPNYAEVTYPSLTPGTFAMMRKNKNSTGAMTSEQFLAFQKAAEVEYQNRKARWREIGAELTFQSLSPQLKMNREMQNLAQDKVRLFITEKLKERIKPVNPPEDRMVPSILIALGVSATPWYFGTGYSQSERAGEAWLIDNAPALMDA